MDFSVVVEGGPQRSSENDRRALERLLRSASVPPDFVESLLPGRRKVLRKNLSYEQAVRLCDRLSHLGLRTAVAPARRAAPAAASPGRQTPPAQSKSLPRRNPAAAIPAGQKAPASSVIAEIKALFSNLPVLNQEVQKTLERQGATRARVWLLSLSILAILCLTVGFYLVAAVASYSALFFLYSLARDYSALLALLILPAALPLSVVLFAAARPWFHPAPREEGLQLSAQSQPRITLFITAICKLLKAPRPDRLVLIASPRLRFQASRSADAPSTLYLGSSLLACLTIAEAAALIAGECARFANTTHRRPYRLAIFLTDYLQACSHATEPGRFFLKLASRMRSDRHVFWARKAAAVADGLHGWGCLPIRLSHKAVTALFNANDPIAQRIQRTMLGHSCAPLHRRTGEVERCYREIIAATLPNEKPDLYAVDRLAELTRSRCKQQSSADRIRSETAVVDSSKPATHLIGNFAKADQQLTRQTYASLGFSSKLVPASPAFLAKRQQQEERLRAVSQKYFAGWIDLAQFWTLPPVNFAQRAEPKILINRLNHCIAKIRYLAPDRSRALAENQRLAAELSALAARREWLADSDSKELKRLQIRHQECHEELHQQNVTMGERIALGLALERQHTAKARRIHQSLFSLGQLADRFSQLIALSEELAAIQKLRVQNPIQRHRSVLQMKSLCENLDNVQRIVVRKLQTCPYDQCDPRFAHVARLLTVRLQARERELGRLTILETSALIRETVSEAYLALCGLAAAYAGKVERSQGVEKIRRI